MDTPLSTRGLHYISKKPLYDGDLMHNMGCYWPVPDYGDKYWQLQTLNAEKFALGRSRARWGYDKQAMFYYPASSGRASYELAARFPQRILEHSLRLSDPEKDGAFMTTQRLAEAVDPALIKAEVFDRNYRDNMAQTEIAASNLRDTYIVGPAHREQLLRALKDYHPVLRGTSYEDATFELHLWGPSCLFDFTQGIYGGGHAWSRNAAMEKAVGLAIQYGSKLPLDLRDGKSFDVVDIYGRPVSILDQAWEDARHIVDVTGMKVPFGGSDFRFRSEPAVALMAVRFMHDHCYRTRTGDLDIERAGAQVKAHYDDPKEVQAMHDLRDVMAPYMAALCDTPTVRAILEQDKALEAYWDEHIAPRALEFTADSEQEAEAFVLGYMPRGGFANADLLAKAERSRDPLSAPRKSYHLAARPHASVGQHENPFEERFNPRLYDDRPFARLGGASDPDQPVDFQHMNFAQAAVLTSMAEFRHDGLAPRDRPRTYMYLDDPECGPWADAFKAKNGIAHPKEIKAAFDPLARAGETFVNSAGKDAKAAYSKRLDELMRGNSFKDWRVDNKLGNIIPYSDFKAALDRYREKRPKTGLSYDKALGVAGSPKMPDLALDALVRRSIDMELDGMILPDGDLSARGYRYMTEGVKAALGLTPRAYEGGAHQFEFYLDFDDAEPRKLDMADLIIIYGTNIKATLEQDNPPPLKDQYVAMARLLDMYEMVMDPGRRNKRLERDPHTGEDIEVPLIDLYNVDPSFVEFEAHAPALPVMAAQAGKKASNVAMETFESDPDYQAFRAGTLQTDSWTNNPARKAKLAKMIWYWMRAEPAQGVGPVNGNLLRRGIQAFDHQDLKDLPPEYKAAKDWWENLNARARTRVLERGVIHAQGPSIERA